MSTVGESLHKDNKIINTYRSRGTFPIAFVCAQKEVGGYRVQSPILLPAKVYVNGREIIGGPNYLSVTIQAHLCEDPSATEFTERSFTKQQHSALS